MIVVRSPSGLSEIGDIALRDAGGLQAIGSALVRDASGLHAIFAPGSGMTIDVPLDSTGARFSSSAGGVTTESVAATVTGGTSPYTYLWSRTDANPESWTILTATSRETQFRAAAVGPGEQFTATFKCTVTDNTGATEDSADVTATAINYGTGV